MSRIAEVLEPVQSWWAGLSLRERRIVMVAVPVLLFGLVWQLVVTPLANSREQAQQRLDNNLQMLERVKTTADDIVRLKQSGARMVASSNQPLDQLVNRTARNFKLSITGLKSKQDALQVTLGNVPFDALLKWVTELESLHGVTLKQLRVSKTEEPGIVTVDRLELERQ